MSRYSTFEKLIVRKEAGYVSDESSMVRLAGLASFETAMFRLTTKIETCLLLLTSHTSLDMFTVDVVVLQNSTSGVNHGRLQMEQTDDEKIEAAWDNCEAKGCHGLLTLAHIDASCLPNNGSRVRYSLSQFVDYLVHGIEAYFMFQKFSPLFTLNAAGLWDTVDSVDMESCYIVLAWKMKDQPRTGTLFSRFPLTQLNTAASIQVQERVRQRLGDHASVTPALYQSKRQDPPTPDERSSCLRPCSTQETNCSLGPLPGTSNQASPPRKRGRPSKTPTARLNRKSSTTEEEEDDEEVTFKVQPPSVKIPEDITSPRTPPHAPTSAPAPALEPEPVPAPAPALPPEPAENIDITFGFESTPRSRTPGRKSTAGRKSTSGRKSLMPDWPEKEKDEVLSFFDNINPKQSEQARIALACKFASMKYDRELPSKLLYQWVQKKGRVVHAPAPGTSYDLPEAQRKEGAVSLFRSLNPDHTEASRVAFTCKFFQTQYGVALQSKQLYDMLANKGKKAKAAGSRRR